MTTAPAGTRQRRRPPQQITRNLNELLQELRVMQTGVQILTGFLLTVPFTDRFGDLSAGQQRLYLGILVTAVLTTLVIVAPVCYHRLLFRQGRRDWIVAAAQRCALVGLAGLAVVSAAVVLLVFDVVLGTRAALIAAAAVALAFTVMWAVVPWRGRTR
ncbi:DUF6328 family protein [Nocardioides daeguensis]|uniref:DUF6328 family protein n=1 Tax=Nocardioides daeguensis TaxID=908359 RepID=A0ABP6VBB9_9ACTN|nr:DUF6328 family protein [Nocardioides daeguensis]MBV6726085.1 sodium:proton antiporter [Nocardioides daeguensis]MCR1771928.1 sodium:proton antiporter [Nocardioides daeguensis]